MRRVLLFLSLIMLGLSLSNPLRLNLINIWLNGAMWLPTSSAEERERDLVLAHLNLWGPSNDYSNTDLFDQDNHCSTIENLLFLSHARRRNEDLEIKTHLNALQNQDREFDPRYFPISLYFGTIVLDNSFFLDWITPVWDVPDIEKFSFAATDNDHSIAIIDYNNASVDRDTLGFTLHRSQFQGGYWAAIQYRVKTEPGTEVRLGVHSPVTGIVWQYHDIADEDWHTYSIPIQENNTFLYLQFVEPDMRRADNNAKIIELQRPQLLLSEELSNCS